MLFTFHRVPLDPTCSSTVKCKVSWISRGFTKLFDKLQFHKLHRSRWNLKQLRCLTQVSFHRSLFVSSWMINTSPGFKVLNTLNRPLFTKSWNFGRPMFVSQNAVRRWWTEMTSKMATGYLEHGDSFVPYSGGAATSGSTNGSDGMNRKLHLQLSRAQNLLLLLTVKNFHHHGRRSLVRLL